MSDVFRLMALDGPVVGVGVLVALAWLTVKAGVDQDRKRRRASRHRQEHRRGEREQTMPEDERRR